MDHPRAVAHSVSSSSPALRYIYGYANPEMEATPEVEATVRRILALDAENAAMQQRRQQV